MKTLKDIINNFNGQASIQEIKTLLQNNAVTSTEKDVLFIWSAEFGYADLVKALLTDPHVNPAIRNNLPIRLASQNGHAEIVKILLADDRVNPAVNRNNPLRIAAQSGYSDVIKLLLMDNRVEPSADNYNALGCAIANGHVEAVRLLAHSCAGFATGALLLAIQNQNTKMVEAILQSSPNIKIDAKDNEGQSLFYHAKGNPSILDMLYHYKSTGVDNSVASQTDESGLVKKLESAILTTKRTAVLGSANKIADIEKSNDWSYEALDDFRFESTFVEEDGAWVREVFNDDRKIILKKVLNDNPFSTLPIFNNAPLLYRVIKNSIAIKSARVANCYELSHFICARLWENAGKDIKRIEIVKAKDFDHVWVIVNRKQGTSLAKPQEWDAWVVDAWWEEGRYYHSSEFNEKIVETLEFFINNCDQLHDFYTSKGNGSVWEDRAIKALNTYYKYMAETSQNQLEVPLTAKIDIDTTVLPYPFFNNRSVEDYYVSMPFTLDQFKKIDLKNERRNYKKQLAHCFQEIRERQANELIIQALERVNYNLTLQLNDLLQKEIENKMPLKVNHSDNIPQSQNAANQEDNDMSDNATCQKPPIGCAFK